VIPKNLVQKNAPSIIDEQKRQLNRDAIWRLHAQEIEHPFKKA